MQAVIIAGGKGTRLGLKDIPKPMVEINGKPLLEHQIELAKRYGIKEFFILSGHLAHIIKDYFGDGENLDVKIEHVIEPKPLGTAGALKLLEGKLNERFMVFYGDIVMDFDIKSFIDFDSKQNSIGTIIVHPNDHPFDSDLIEINSENKVKRFIPKPHNQGRFYQNLVNAAIYIFSQRIFDFIENDKKQDFGKDILPKLITQGESVYGYKTAEYIKDMGTQERFPSVKKDFETGKVSRFNKAKKRACIFLDRDGVINKDMDSNPNINEFELLEGVGEAIKRINQSDYLAVIVTNQPMIAKGFIAEDKVHEIHKKMETLLGEQGAFINEIYYCPHHPEKGFEGEIPELKIDCECRKPKSGMLLKAQKEMNIDLKESWMIGDNERDLIAGKNVGCKTVYISKEKSIYADYYANNLKEAVNTILENS